MTSHLQTQCVIEFSLVLICDFHPRGEKQREEFSQKRWCLGATDKGIVWHSPSSKLNIFHFKAAWLPSIWMGGSHPWSSKLAGCVSKKFCSNHSFVERDYDCISLQPEMRQENERRGKSIPKTTVSFSRQSSKISALRSLLSDSLITWRVMLGTLIKNRVWGTTFKWQIRGNFPCQVNTERKKPSLKLVETRCPNNA